MPSGNKKGLIIFQSDNKEKNSKWGHCFNHTVNVGGAKVIIYFFYLDSTGFKFLRHLV